MPSIPLPLPPHYDPGSVGRLWRVPYEQRAAEAEAWAREHDLRPAAEDRHRVCLLAIDVQNTFCLPDFELFVGGRSGRGAVDDNERLCDFVYRYLPWITRIIPTLDTHQAAQIFHAVFFVNEAGEHPAPYTQITAEAIERGAWRFNSALAPSLGQSADYVQAHLRHYTRALESGGQYALTVWPCTQQPARLSNQGESPPDRTLLRARPGSADGPGRRPDRRAEPGPAGHAPGL
jgi:hypothetical protein